MVWKPRVQTSPTSPSARASPLSGSAIATSTPGSGAPHVKTWSSTVSSAVVIVTTAASVRP